METGLNVSGLSIDKNGRVSFSGLSTGIDFKAAVDAIIAARRIPADSLEARVDSNTAKIAAISELRAALSSLRDRMDKLRGAVTFGGVNNVFKAKQAFASASRTDTASPSAVGELVGLAVSNGAALGSRTLEIERIATAHKIGSGTFTSTTASLQTARGLGSPVSGSFTVNGQTVSVLATDSLGDLRDRINNANTGDNATGVTASIVTVTSTQHILVLTADKTGETITLADPGATGVLGNLGISNNGGATLSNELQVAQTTRMYADGLLNSAQHQSAAVASQTAQIGSYTSVSGTGHTFEIQNEAGTAIKTITYDDTDTLQTLAAKITDGGLGLTGQVVADGGNFRLEIVKNDGAAIQLGNDSNNLLSDFGFTRKRLLIERTSNTVSDVFTGVTLTLFKAEPGTTIKLDIEQDLAQVKTAVANFVEAYNALTVRLNSHQQVDPTTGAKTAEAGVLFGSRVVAEIESRIGAIVGGGADGTSSAFSVLAQIGIKFVDNSTVEDPLLFDTLEVDDSTLDAALLNNPQQFRKLFAFDFSTSDPRVTLIGFDGQTTYNAAGYTLNIQGTGSSREDSAAIVSKTDTLDQGTSFAATTSGQFEINGTAIIYDVATDTLETLAQKINDAAITGVSATAASDGAGGFVLRIASTTNAITVANDTGNLVAALSLETKDRLVTGANINGAGAGTSDGSVTINGAGLKATGSTGASGLNLFFAGEGAASGIDINFSVGIASKLFFEIDQLLASNGVIEAETDALEGQNIVAEERIATMLERLEFQRQVLTDGFIKMETALATMNRILESVRQATEAMFQSGRN